ncbi:hypothetical protein [Bosea sp. (in: a-proteobacteria)]|uniref:hypothetical protein n=1 Tax=Bosea sp. (in: a-proteobacteria) TaxID=1871050 RepID=UPI002FC844CA
MRLVGWPRLALAVLLAVFAVPAAAAEPLLDVQDVAVLRQLEASGYGFADVLGAGKADSTAELSRDSAAWRLIAGHVGEDVAALRAEMLANGRRLHEVTDGNVGRVIDLGWLRSPIARFQLTAIVNRLDRQDFAALSAEAGCGEVRLIFRLAYAFDDAKRKRRLASRLPFTLNAVFGVPTGEDGSCRQVAQAWLVDEAGEPAALARKLASGPLAKARLRLKQIELNAQIVRFPSGMETQFGGQAAYLQRIFAAVPGEGGARLRPKRLENMPDVARLKADAGLRRELVDYVRANLPAIDRGVYLVPERFLALKAISYSTFGSARLANHPFTEALPAGAFAGLDYGAARLVRGEKALLERLDNGSCTGCHQAGGTAGFHMFGLDDASTSALNRIKVGISPHLHAEGFRRAAYVAALAAGAEPDRYRPPSFAPPANWQAGQPFGYQPAALTMPCLTTESAKAFGEGWSCAAGSTCKALVESKAVGIELGQCLRLEEARNFSGQPCLTGAISTAVGKPYLDRYRQTGQFGAFAKGFSQTAFNCRPAKIGVPGGMAYRQCTPGDRIFAGFANGKVPDEICGLAGGKAFDDCVATNQFDACLAKAVTRGNRGTCSATSFCREDYMCQAIPDDVPGATTTVKDYGFCSPTYFLFQMRIDGHPDPQARP